MGRVSVGGRERRLRHGRGEKVEGMERKIKGRRDRIYIPARDNLVLVGAPMDGKWAAHVAVAVTAAEAN